VPDGAAAGGISSKRRAPRERPFLLTACFAAFAIVLICFAPTYYLKLLNGAPALPALLHVHGALMTSWFVLFFTQIYLIASHRVHLHRRLGIVGAVVAGLIVLIGATVDIRAVRLGHMPPEGPPPLQFMGFLLFALLVFAALVAAALVLRRRPDYHKRLMLLSCFSLVGPGVFRIPLQWFPPALAFLKTGGLAGLLGLDLMPVYACIVWDTWRHRRLHPAFLCGALLIAAEDLPFIWGFLATPAWMHFAAQLVG
jgi:hypothetical protein